MRHQRKKVGHLVEALCEGVECGVRRGRGLVFRQRIDSIHETSLDKVMFSWGGRGSVHPICEGERQAFPETEAADVQPHSRIIRLADVLIADWILRFAQNDSVKANSQPHFAASG